MSDHSIADAKTHLSALIERAMSGEEIVITRHGHPVVALKPVRPPPRRITEADIVWLRERRVGTIMPDVPAGEFVSRMRDEEDSK